MERCRESLETERPIRRPVSQSKRGVGKDREGRGGRKSMPWGARFYEMLPPHPIPRLYSSHQMEDRCLPAASGKIFSSENSQHLILLAVELRHE